MGILTLFLGFIFHFSVLYSFHTSSTEKVVDLLTVRSLTGAILKYPVKILGTGGQISTLSGQDFSFSGNFAVRLPRLPQKVYLGYNTAYRIDFVDSGLFAYMRTPSQNIGNPELREFSSFEAICLHNEAREATPDKIKRQKASKDGTQVSLFSLDWRYPTIVGEELIAEQQYIFSKEFIACYQKGDWVHRLSLEGVTHQEGQNFYDSLKIF